MFRSLALTVGARLLGDLVTAPATLLHAAGRALEDFAASLFLYEFEGARRYKLLTGLDLGNALDDPDRYAALDPDFGPDGWAVVGDEEEDED